MPWQEWVADVALEVEPDPSGDGWVNAYTEVVLTIMRQTGKTTLVLPVITHRCTADWPGGLLDSGPQPQSTAYTAQTRNDARKKWMKDFTPALSNSPFRNQFHTRLTNGSEGWDWRNGSTFDLLATMEKSGHGDVNDLTVLDEIFAQQDWRLEQAVIPAQNTRRSPQRWPVSTAGESAVKSPYLWSKVEVGRARCEAGEPSRSAYFEWSFADDEDPGDPAVWWRRHPALGYTVTEATIQAAYDSMALDEFRRAFGNMWGSTETQGHLPIGDFDLCGSETAAVDMDSPVAFAVDVTPDRGRTSVVAVGRMTIDGETFPVAELIADRAGTDWVPQFMVERQRNQLERGPFVGVAIDSGSAAGSLADDIAAMGVTVKRMTTRDMCHAAGRLFDAVTDKRFRWRTDQPAMRVAAVGAVKRDVGESWLFARRAAVVNICPTIGTSQALWMLETADEEETEPSPFVMVVGGS